MKTTALILLSLIAFNTQAKTLGQGRGACISAELFDQYVTAIVTNDELSLEYLLKVGCVITSGGQSVSVLDSNWGTVHVRAYTDEMTVELWTYSENIVD